MPVYYYVIRTSLPTGSFSLTGEIKANNELTLKEVVLKIEQELKQYLPLNSYETLYLLNQDRVDCMDEGEMMLQDGDTLTLLSLPLAGG